jgi:hypothetical protein
VTARELDVLHPLVDEIRWAGERTRTDEHLLGLLVSLKSSSAWATSPVKRCFPRSWSSASTTAWTASGEHPGPA